MVSYHESYPTKGFSSAPFGRAVTSFDPDDTASYRKRRASATRTGRPVQPIFKRIVTLCSQRDRSAYEVEQRLRKEGYPDADIPAALQRAIDCNLINDERFTDAYIQRSLARGKGSRAIVCELNDTYGININEHDDTFAAYELDDETQGKRAIDFLCAHPPKAKNAQAAAYRKLISKGYPHAIAYSAARRWFNETHS